MGRVHRFLGLEVGVILSAMRPAERRQQYAADITYGTNNEFGFDYLRDNMAWSGRRARPARPQLRDRRRGRLDPDRRGPHAADHQRPGRPGDQVVRRLRQDRAAGSARDGDYEVDEKKRTVGVLERGVERVEDYLGIENLYESANTPLVGYLNNAIKAKELFKRDKDYVVMNGEVLIVDEHTGRMLAGRRYNEGMHQAIEAKEGVEIKQENQTLATITLQNFFRLYDKLSGMTGTAMTEAAEFSQIYKLGVVPDPDEQDMIRKDQADLVYKTEEAKFNAVVDDIAERNKKGQPILVGTVSVEKSEHLSTPAEEARHPARGPQRQAARARGRDRRPGRPQGRRHGGHQHGRPRHRHHARRQRRVPRRPASCARAASTRSRPREDYEKAWPEAVEHVKQRVGGRARRGHRDRRPLRPRHRAPRVAAHRQPAARPLRPAGRPGRVPVLPLPRRRPDAAVQRRDGRDLPDPLQHPRRRARSSRRW